MASGNFLRPFTHSRPPEAWNFFAARVVRVLDYSAIPALALPGAPACVVKDRRQT